MAKLSSSEKLRLEKIFDMNSGYVLNFSNRSFQEFVLDNIGIDIQNEKYSYASGSKANRLRSLWNKEENETVGKLIIGLLEHWKVSRELDNKIITLEERSLYEECFAIGKRLVNNMPPDVPSQNALEIDRKKVSLSEKLNRLLATFEDMARSADHQRRGYLLEELLNELFKISDIPAIKSFRRNDNGEQIDGAFTFKGWHYLVECKWTEKLSDIKQLDSLLGKVNRSGKQMMGLFLSIDGWSINVPALLKQNPEKCIFLMDGYDLRCVLNNEIDLALLIQTKIAKLNLEAEPFISARRIIET